MLNQNIGHHLPIFAITDINKNYKHNANNSEYDDEIIHPLHFDFCNNNVENFLESAHTAFARYPLNYCTNFSDFTYEFNNILYSTCLSKVATKVKRSRVNNPWITPAIINSIKTKHKLYKKWRKTVTPTNKSGNETLYETYSKYRKTLKYAIKMAKRAFHHKKFNNAAGDMKNTWQLINDLRGKHKEKPKPSFIINSELVKNRRIIANEFNAYFTDLATKLNEDMMVSGIPIAPIPDFSSYLSPATQDSIYLEDCSHIEIEKIISDFSNDTSSDIPIILKKNVQKLYHRYLHITFTSLCKPVYSLIN